MEIHSKNHQTFKNNLESFITIGEVMKEFNEAL